jgi:hypothetical protein
LEPKRFEVREPSVEVPIDASVAFLLEWARRGPEPTFLDRGIEMFEKGSVEGAFVVRGKFTERGVFAELRNSNMGSRALHEVEGVVSWLLVHGFTP